MRFVRSFALLSLFLLSATPAGAITVNDFCASGADPCEFKGAPLNVDTNTTLDFGSRTLIIALKADSADRLFSRPSIDFIRQVEAAHNEDDVNLFYGYAHPNGPAPEHWADVETTALVPGFVLSELKVAFLMGFRIYLPFLIIDMVISSVLISIGMQLLPPVMVSLPFKLLLFVLVDGWHLVCGTLLSSFG